MVDLSETNIDKHTPKEKGDGEFQIYLDHANKDWKEQVSDKTQVVLFF